MSLSAVARPQAGESTFFSTLHFFTKVDGPIFGK